MTYTGNVHVGGDPAVRELTGLVVEKLAVGEMNNNAYLLRCRATGDQLLVDAAAEPERLLDLVGPDGLVGIVTTHQHWDHWTGLADVVAATAAPTYAHAADAPGIDVPTARTLADGRCAAVRGRRAARHPPGRAHARVDRLGVRRPGRAAARVDRRLPVPGRPGPHDDVRRLRVTAATASRPRSSARCLTRPGSTPGTATTRPWVPSVRTSPSGARGVGDRGAPNPERVRRVRPLGRRAACGAGWPRWSGPGRSRSPRATR